MKNEQQSSQQQSALDLSVVIGAYNEQKRLPPTLRRLFFYLDGLGVSYEIIVVNDGSTDRTKEIVEEMAKERHNLRLFSHFPNKGRGAAIRRGVLSARGNIILETDADGSVEDEAIGRFLDYFKTHPEIDCIFGSRMMRGAKIAKNQPLLRVFLGYGFIMLAKVMFLMPNISDFTLGFKMFRRSAAQDIFSYQYDHHYLAEAEIVYIARRRGWKIVQLPVTWTDNRDSRVRPFKESLRSFKGMLRVISRDIKGYYTRDRSGQGGEDAEDKLM